MTTECEKYLKAQELVNLLIRDIFSIIEVGFGKEMAKKLYSEFIKEDEEGGCPCSAEQEQEEMIMRDYKMMQSALKLFAKLHGIKE